MIDRTLRLTTATLYAIWTGSSLDWDGQALHEQSRVILCATTHACWWELASLQLSFKPDHL